MRLLSISHCTHLEISWKILGSSLGNSPKTEIPENSVHMDASRSWISSTGTGSGVKSLGINPQRHVKCLELSIYHSKKDHGFDHLDLCSVGEKVLNTRTRRSFSRSSMAAGVQINAILDIFFFLDHLSLLNPVGQILCLFLSLTTLDQRFVVISPSRPMLSLQKRPQNQGFAFFLRLFWSRPLLSGVRIAVPAMIAEIFTSTNQPPFFMGPWLELERKRAWIPHCTHLPWGIFPYLAPVCTGSFAQEIVLRGKALRARPRKSMCSWK